MSIDILFNIVESLIYTNIDFDLTNLRNDFNLCQNTISLRLLIIRIWC